MSDDRETIQISLQNVHNKRQKLTMSLQNCVSYKVKTDEITYDQLSPHPTWMASERSCHWNLQNNCEITAKISYYKQSKM